MHPKNVDFCSGMDKSSISVQRSTKGDIMNIRAEIRILCECGEKFYVLHLPSLKECPKCSEVYWCKIEKESESDEKGDTMDTMDTMDNYDDCVYCDDMNTMDNYNCPCGCGNCSTCSPFCGENGQKCPDGQCLGKIKNV